MKILFQNTLIFLIILLQVSCQTIQPRTNNTEPVKTYNNPPKIISFEAEPPFVPEGNPYTLSWKTQDATEVHISGIGQVNPSGHYTVNNPNLDKEKIILTAINNSGFPPATKQLAMQVVMFSTKAPPGVPFNKPVLMLADQHKLKRYEKNYRFQPIHKIHDPGRLRPATPPAQIKPTRVVRTQPLRQMDTATRVHDHRSGLPAPRLLSPANHKRFNHYPRNLTLRWQAVANAKNYTLEIDCLNCCARGKWCTDVGKKFKRVPGLTRSHYKFQFVGAQAGRWRVQAVDKNGKPGRKSQWYNFVFTR